MSSGFVSGGTSDAPIERSDEWLAAQQELEAAHRRKAEESRQADGRSLFETLQANKAAKEEAFAEAAKLKNQFRALDEDEIEFLDSILESTRREEDRVKKETAEGLEAFRRQQDEADKKLRRASAGADAEATPADEEEEWANASRKRKRAKEKEGLKGVKLRKSSSSAEQGVVKGAALTGSTSNKTLVPHSPAEGSGPSQSAPGADTSSAAMTKSPLPASVPPLATSTPNEPVAPPKGLPLVSYGSDSDD
ncbi:MAG: hypothetical protein M1818_007498 [Claussenomyces sp. TS43310]|nr:MAG: hypothetical protein M1818_007498 [Claussenomyces sp. TS43310]